MVKTLERRSGSCLRRILTVIFAAGFVGSSLFASSAFAKNSTFTVQGAAVTKKTDGVTAEIISINDSSVSTGVRFHEPGDSATYKITIKNTDSKDHIISSISDNNSSAIISYSYDAHEDFEIAAGESFDFDVMAKYAELSSDPYIALSTSFIITFDGGEEAIGINPGTNDGVMQHLTILAISATGLIISIFIGHKNYKQTLKLSVVAIAVSALVLPTAAQAASLATENIMLNAIYCFDDSVENAITFSVEKENEWAASKSVELNFLTLSSDFRRQYSLDGGETWNNYTEPFVIKENNQRVIARIADAEGNEVISEEKTVIKIDPVVPTVSITLGGSYYSGEALDLSTVTTYTAGESGATVRWFAGDVELTNLSDTYLIDRIEEQYEVAVRAVVTSGAGLSAEDESETIIIKYARWDNYLIGDLTRDNIGSVQFVAWGDMPGDESDWTDISVNRDGAVKEAYILDPATNLYDVYIASPYGYSRYKDDSMGSNFLPAAGANIDHITSASQGGVNSCQDHYGMFAYMPNLKTIDFGYLDMFNINDMSCMFSNIDFNTTYWNATSALATITWGEKFNTVNVTNMAFAFAGLVNLQSLDLSSFDTSSVVSMKGLFAKNESLQSLELANWDTSKVRDFSYVFYSTPNLKDYDITNWNTSSAITLNGTFYAAGVETLDLSKWDVSHVESFYQLFENANQLTSIDMSNWDTSNVIDMSWMFNRTAVSDLDLSHFNTSKVERMGDMFSNTPNLTSIDVSNFDTSNVWDMNGMFSQTKIKELDLDSFNTDKVRDFGYFAWKSEAETINFRHLTFSSPNDFYCMFWNATKLKNIYVETIPTVPAGSRTTAMWTNAGTNHFTAKTYDD